jgi:hypothetical protein
MREYKIQSLADNKVRSEAFPTASRRILNPLFVGVLSKKILHGLETILADMRARAHA